MRQRDWSAVVAVGPLALIYAVVCYYMAAAVTEAERKPVEESPAAYELPYEDVEFPSRSPEIILSGWYIAGAGTGPTIVFVHGIHANRESDHALELSARLVDGGYEVLLFDLRGHGRSSGKEVSGGYFERQDVHGALDFLEGRGVPRDRIGLLGNSMGAAIAILTAADEPTIRAVVADSPFADVADLVPQETARVTPLPEALIRAFVPGMKLEARVFFGIDLGALAPERAVARLQIPLLLIHGTGDTRIAHQHSVRIQRAAKHPETRLWLVADLDHVEAFASFPDEYARNVLAYLDRQLGAAPPE